MAAKILVRKLSSHPQISSRSLLFFDRVINPLANSSGIDDGVAKSMVFHSERAVFRLI